MKQIHIMAAAVAATFCMAASSPSAAAEAAEYSCALRVGTASADQSTTKDGGTTKKSGRNKKTSVKTKTTSRSLTWPVTVSITGKSRPPADSVKLKCYFMGTTNGRPALLGEKTVSVDLDEKGLFKTEVTSPSEKLVHTTTRTNSRGRRNYGGGRNRSSSLKTETTGSRVTGCIIQLVVKGKVERAYTSNSNWSKAARNPSLTESDILGTK